MKILTSHVGLTDAELAFMVEPQDIGNTFTCVAGMIRYSCGGGAMSGISVKGIGVRLGYKEIGEQKNCQFCQGSGALTSKKKVGLFRKREVTESVPCCFCDGSGKKKVYRQIPVEEGGY